MCLLSPCSVLISTLPFFKNLRGTLERERKRELGGKRKRKKRREEKKKPQGDQRHQEEKKK